MMGMFMFGDCKSTQGSLSLVRSQCESHRRRRQGVHAQSLAGIEESVGSHDVEGIKVQSERADICNKFII